MTECARCLAVAVAVASGAATGTTLAAPAGTPPGSLAVSDGTVRVWAEQGWVQAQRRDSAGDLVWHVVVAPAVASAPELAEESGLLQARAADGSWWLRDDTFFLRATLPSATELPPLDPRKLGLTKARSLASKPGRSLSLWTAGEWAFLAVGAEPDRPRAVVRATLAGTLSEDTTRFLATSSGSGAVLGQLGPHHVFYDGLLLLARRMSPDERRRAETRVDLSGRPAPELAPARWLNAPEPPRLADLRGRVVLVNFWGLWCPPCIDAAPRVERLQRTYADRGLAVVTVHSAWGTEGLEDYLGEEGFTFPVAVDEGSTARAYGVSGWPAYFLVDRTGRVRHSGNRIPATDEIEAALAASP